MECRLRRSSGRVAAEARGAKGRMARVVAEREAYRREEHGGAERAGAVTARDGRGPSGVYSSGGTGGGTSEREASGDGLWQLWNA